MSKVGYQVRRILRPHVIGSVQHQGGASPTLRPHDLWVQSVCNDIKRTAETGPEEEARAESSRKLALATLQDISRQTITEFGFVPAVDFRRLRPHRRVRPCRYIIIPSCM